MCIRDRLWYALQCGGMLCIALFVSAVSCFASLLLQRMSAGVAASCLTCVLIGLWAYYPGYLLSLIHILRELRKRLSSRTVSAMHPRAIRTLIQNRDG